MAICNTISRANYHRIVSVDPISFHNDGRQPSYSVNLDDKIITVFCSIVNGYNHRELEESYQQLIQQLNSQITLF